MKPSTHSDMLWFVRCKLMALERRCTDSVEHIKTVLEVRLHSDVSHTHLWDKTVSFFTPKKTPIFHDGYSKYSRETLRLFPDPDEDVIPLCFQQWCTSRLKDETTTTNSFTNTKASTVKVNILFNCFFFFCLFLLKNGKEFLI